MSRYFIVKPNLYTVEWKRILSAATDITKSESMSTSENSSKSSASGSSENKDSELVIPEAPTNCCMSGCANCVWIQYAEELTRLFKDGGKTSRAREIILQKVDDPNMKAFLMTELRALESKLEDSET